MNKFLGEPPAWFRWLQIIPLVLLPLLAGGTAWVAYRVDTANSIQETQLRKDYVEKETYVSDRKVQEYMRDQLDKRLDRIDKKLDELIQRRR